MNQLYSDPHFTFTGGGSVSLGCEGLGGESRACIHRISFGKDVGGGFHIRRSKGSSEQITPAGFEKKSGGLRDQARAE